MPHLEMASNLDLQLLAMLGKTYDIIGKVLRFVAEKMMVDFLEQMVLTERGDSPRAISATCSWGNLPSAVNLMGWERRTTKYRHEYRVYQIHRVFPCPHAFVELL